MNKIILKDIVETDFVNYRKPSMFLIFPCCSFKCGDKECQNYIVSHQQDLTLSIDEIIQMYQSNPITKAIVCGGLEPLDTPEQLIELLAQFRFVSTDDFVIYTGYTEQEVKLMKYKNTNLYDVLMYISGVVIKFGRYIPNQQPHYDEVLGINLVSDNQYAVRSFV